MASGAAEQSALERLFAGKPASARLFRIVRRYIESLGPVAVVPLKTQVAFGHGRRFAWVWMPQMWIKKQPEGSITVTFSLDCAVRDHRIKEVVEPYPSRFIHHVVIGKAQQIDARLKGWLREAYELAAQRPPNRTRRA